MPRTTKTPHAELVLHTLLYVSQTLAGGDVHSVLDLGFRPDQVARLRRLTLANLHRLARAPGHFLEVSVDPACLDRLLAHLERTQEADDLQDALILQRAPLAMLHALYQTTAAEYAARRKLLGMASVGIGRPPSPTPAQETACWNAWIAHGDLDQAQRCLAVARATELPLCTVWSLVQSWELAGHRQTEIAAPVTPGEPMTPMAASVSNARGAMKIDHDGGR